MLVWLRELPKGATLVQQPGQLAEALAEATEGGGMARKERSAWDGSSTSFGSSPFSSTYDHIEVAVVAGKWCQEPWQASVWV